jgi:hypothetical protein
MTTPDEIESAGVGAMRSSAAESVTRDFVDAINRRSVDDLADLMTEDHVFTDSLGNEVFGRDLMRQGWTSYLEMFPDYSITVAESFHSGSVVVLVGTALGTYCVNGRMLPENRWQMPAAWRASIRGQHVAQRQVFADNDAVRRLTGSSEGTRGPLA